MRITLGSGDIDAVAKSLELEGVEIKSAKIENGLVAVEAKATITKFGIPAGTHKLLAEVKAGVGTDSLTVRLAELRLFGGGLEKDVDEPSSKSQGLFGLLNSAKEAIKKTIDTVANSDTAKAALIESFKENDWLKKDPARHMLTISLNKLLGDSVVVKFKRLDVRESVEVEAEIGQAKAN